MIGRISRHLKRRVQRSRMRLAGLAIAAAMAAPQAAQAQVDPRDLAEFSIQFEQPFDQPGIAMPSLEQLRGVTIDPGLRTLVVQLDDASFETREEATQRLLDAATDKMQLYAMLASGDLTAEQRYRLLAVVREHLVRTPRGAIGISMNPFMLNAAGQIEIRVTDLLPGLPAERVLRIGDRITMVDGRPLMASDDLQFRVQSKRPGEKVNLTVRRTKTDEQGQMLLDADNQPTYEVIEVELELGSADLLRDVPGQLNQPSRVQSSRQQEAAEVARKFRPQARALDARGGAQALLSATARHNLADDEDDGDGDEYADVDVEQFPAVRSLILDRRRIARGEMLETKLVRDAWKTQLAEMMVIARQPNLNDEQRELINRVIQRYIELMEAQ